MSVQTPLVDDLEDDLGVITGYNSNLFAFSRCMTSLVDECQIRVADGKLRATAIDPTNVGRVEVTVELEGESNVNTPAGLYVDDMAAALQNKPRSENQDCFVTMDLGQPYAVVEIDQEIQGKQWTMLERIGMPDPNSVREYSDPLSDPTEAVTVDIPVSALYSWLDAAEDTHIEWTVEDGGFAINVVADDGYHARMETSVDSETDATALFSQDYLKDMVGSLRAVGIDTAKALWADDFPLSLRAETESMTVEYQLAPRVRND